YLYFFFSSRRRHTRFSRDWSSDVCSSDLCVDMAQQFAAVDAAKLWIGIGKMLTDVAQRARPQQGIAERMQQHIAIGMGDHTMIRSEERRVGKECRSPRPAKHEKKKITRHQ